MVLSSFWENNTINNDILVSFEPLQVKHFCVIRLLCYINPIGGNEGTQCSLEGNRHLSIKTENFRKLSYNELFNPGF